jgi:tRNA threonylcarbamoyladenosine biosynthesis protein TsaE
MERRTSSEAETRSLGAALGRAALRTGVLQVIALTGPLGAGKTCLVQGLARGLGVPEDRRVGSPTFTLLNEHRGAVALHHADLYRVERAEELAELGIDEAVAQGGVTVIEWAERFPEVLPPDHLTVAIEPTSESQRRFTLTADGPRAQALLAALGE